MDLKSRYLREIEILRPFNASPVNPFFSGVSRAAIIQRIELPVLVYLLAPNAVAAARWLR